MSNSAAEKQQQDPANDASEVKRMRISGTATTFKKKVMINHEQSSAIAAILSKKNRTNNSSSQAEIQPVSDPLMLSADSSDFNNIGNQL